MAWLWHALVVAAIVIPIAALCLSTLVDLLRRDDLGGWARVVWLAAVAILPVFGPPANLMVAWRRSGQADDTSADLPAGSDSVAVERGAPSMVDQLARLDELRRTGALNEYEFGIGKRLVLSDDRRASGRHAAEEAIP